MPTRALYLRRRFNEFRKGFSESTQEVEVADSYGLVRNEKQPRNERMPTEPATDRRRRDGKSGCRSWLLDRFSQPVQLERITEQSEQYGDDRNHPDKRLAELRQRPQFRQVSEEYGRE